MKIQSPPGMRDFYPEDMRLQNWLFDAWRRVSRSFGFSEYEGPIFEFLDLYTLKSGDEIVKQLFRVRHGAADEGGDKFAIRPEMTPTLARMVAARANALPRPIKWFSIPRMCRAERQQRGRLREFFQWNVDVLGVDDPIADAEVVAVVVEFFRQIELSESDVCVKISSKPLLAAVLTALNYPPDQHAPIAAQIDAFAKIEEGVWRKTWAEKMGAEIHPLLFESIKGGDSQRVMELARQGGDAGIAAVVAFEEFWSRLEGFGVRPYCRFDFSIVRGLAYYTGIVFEAHMRGLRALCGGGRYDNLCEMLDGPKVSGVGFGMGDAPMIEALREIKRLPALGESIDLFVVDADEQYYAQALDVVGQLRRAGMRVDFSYKRQPIGKQLKQASSRGAGMVLIVGPEFAAANQLLLKNMATGTQEPIEAARLLADPHAALGGLTR